MYLSNYISTPHVHVGDADLEAREAALRERGDNQEMETDGGEERPEGRVSPPISEAAREFG